MKSFIKVFQMASLLAATVLVSACGGGTTTASTGGSQSTVLTGTAAAGAPIIGSVTIKDSTTPTAQTKTVTIAADGNYQVDVTGMKAPYMVRADGYVGGNEYHLYSAATASDVGGTINITPLTDLIVANIAGSVAKTYFDNGSFSGLTASQLTTQSNALEAKLLPVLTAIGVSGSIDLLRASFSPDHTGLDAVLDAVKITTDTTTNVATITNIITRQQITSNIATGAFSGILDNVTGVATGVTDIQAISARFKQFTALYATSIPSASNPTLVSLFDSATFLQSGENLASFLSDITTDNSMIGIAFTNTSVVSMDTTNGTAIVAFDVLQNGIVQQDAPKSWSMIKKADGKWYMQGDQRVATVHIRSDSRYDVNNNLIQTGLRLDIEDSAGKGFTSAVVTGKGLAAPVTLVNNVNQNWFVVSSTNDDFYSLTDAQIGTIADTGEIYTVKLYTGTVLKATYTERVQKRPYLNSELTTASFASFSATTVTQFSTFKGGSLPVSWTLPSGLISAWYDINLSDNSGNSASVENSLAPTDKSATGILNAQTSTGQNFTAAHGWLSISTHDSYGRVLEAFLSH